MKWTKEQEKQLRELCEKGVPNAEIAATLKIKIKDVHAARSRLGITIPKIQAQAQAQAKKQPATKKTTDPLSHVKKAFDSLEKALMDAGQEDPTNTQNFRHAAVAASTTKSLLLAALAE